MKSHQHHVISNHQSFECLFNSLFHPTSKTTSELCITGHQWLVDSPHKGPVIQKSVYVMTSSWQMTAAVIFSCDQAAIWLVQSVRPSVRLSVCPSVTPFSPCSHHCIIMKFSGVITMVRSDVHAKGQGQKSKVKVTEVNTQLSRFRTLTPAWIHVWQWNHAHSSKQHRRGALLFFKVIRQISRSHGSKNRRIWPRLGVSGL